MQTHSPRAKACAPDRLCVIGAYGLEDDFGNDRSNAFGARPRSED
jgi:hypothetical protein